MSNGLIGSRVYLVVCPEHGTLGESDDAERVQGACQEHWQNYHSAASPAGGAIAATPAPSARILVYTVQSIVPADVERRTAAASRKTERDNEPSVFDRFRVSHPPPRSKAGETQHKKGGR